MKLEGGKSSFAHHKDWFCLGTALSGSVQTLKNLLLIVYYASFFLSHFYMDCIHEIKYDTFTVSILP